MLCFQRFHVRMSGIFEYVRYIVFCMDTYSDIISRVQMSLIKSDYAIYTDCAFVFQKNSVNV